jgi:hypothetical protein
VQVICGFLQFKINLENKLSSKLLLGAGPPTGAAASAWATTDGASDADLAEFGERLLALDENNVAERIQLNTGCTTRVGSPNDCSANRLFAQARNSHYCFLFSVFCVVTDNLDKLFFTSSIKQITV